MPGVDALRGIAAVLVALFHWEHIGLGTSNGDQVFRLGLLGVELFFMISGFVILMVAERTTAVPHFLIARAVRLYPAYVVAVALTGIYVLIVGKYDLAAVLVNLTMLQSFVGVPNIANPFWTLAFEVSFYAGMAIVLRLGLLPSIERVALVWLAVAVIYRLLAPEAMLLDPARPLATLAFVLLAPQFAPFFVTGMMLWRIVQRRCGPEGFAALAAALAMTFAGRGDFAQVPGVTYGLLSCLMGAALLVAARLRAGPMLQVGAYLGLISYPLYLLHCTLANGAVLAGGALGVEAPIAVVASALASVLLAALIHERLERPAQRWGHRVFSPH